MHDEEMQRIAQIYKATAPDMDEVTLQACLNEVARRAYQEPLVPVAEIMATVVARQWRTRGQCNG